MCVQNQKIGKKTIQDDYLFYRDLKLDNMVLENDGKVKITGN
jgi:hypothetical protein